MNPEEVKLSLFKNIKLLFRATQKEKKIPLVVFCLFTAFYGGFLSFSTPSFMTNIVANFIIHIILAVGYIVATVFIIVGLELIWDNDDNDSGLKQVLNKILVQFKKDQLEAKKIELENIDNILLGDKK
jgi:hypothetical protein